MARSAEDPAVSMNAVAGARSSEAIGWQLNLPRPQKKSLKEFKVALWQSDDMSPVAKEISDRVQTIGDTLAKLGATVADAKPNIDLNDAMVVYSSLLWGVMSAGMPEDQKEEMRTARMGLDVDDHRTASNYVRYSVQDHSEWGANNTKRQFLRQAWQHFFSDWDILICPQTATTAFPHDHGEYMNRQLMVDNEPQDYFQQLFWAGVVTVAHLPSTVFPTGPSSEGLPIGLQAVGAEFNDYCTIDFTRLLAEEIGGFVPPPNYS
jgi:amidase